MEVMSSMTSEKICVPLCGWVRSCMLRMTKSCPTGRRFFIMSPTTSSMSREWKTLRLMVRRRTMKGKSERMVLAATLEGVGVDLGARHVAGEGNDLGAEAPARERRTGRPQWALAADRAGRLGRFGLIGNDERHRRSELDRSGLLRC